MPLMELIETIVADDWDSWNFEFYGKGSAAIIFDDGGKVLLKAIDDSYELWEQI